MTACALGVTCVQDTYDMDHELPNVIFALCSHLLELAGLIIIVSIYQPYFLAGAVRVLNAKRSCAYSEMHQALE